MPCPQCYESDASICPKAGDMTAVCAGFCADPISLRSGHGEYPASFRTTLPPATRSTDSVHLDSLLGYVASPLEAPVLTAEEQAVVDDMDTLLDNNLNLAVSIVAKRPNLRGEVEARMDVLANGATQALTARLTHIANRIDTVCKLAKDKVSDLKPGTGLAYKQTTYPQATLFQSIIKSVVRGLTMLDEGKEMFDPSTGKTYVPFEKATKVNSDSQIMFAANTFVMTMLGVKKEAPKVYYEFIRDLSRVVDDKGHRFAQEYVDNLLRMLDEKRFPSMVSLYISGEPSRTFTELASRLDNKFTDDKHKMFGGTQNAPGHFQGPNGLVRFGPVTNPKGGEGSGWIPKKCNRFHCDPRKNCSAGIPANSGFPANLVGLCAYEH